MKVSESKLTECFWHEVIDGMKALIKVDCEYSILIGLKMGILVNNNFGKIILFSNFDGYVRSIP